MASIYHNGDMIGSSLAIDDTQTSDKTTWSSEKITEEIENVVTDTITEVADVTKHEWTVALEKNGVASVAYRFVVGNAAITTPDIPIATLGVIRPLSSVYVQYVNRDDTSDIVLGIITDDGIIRLMSSFVLKANTTYLMYATFLTK